MKDEVDERRHHTLTEADLDRIVDKLEKRLLGRFYINLGKGVWAIAWKGLVVLLLGIAAFGHFGKSGIS